MASTLATRRGMAILGISSERSFEDPRGGSVRFSLEIDGHARVRLDVPNRYIWGDPSDVDSGSEASAKPVKFPDGILGAIHDAILVANLSVDPLWLEFRNPSEDLPSLFWEEIIQPVIHRPLIRLPYTPFLPLSSPVPLDVVLIGSSPHAKMWLPLDDYLAALSLAMLEVGGVKVTVHLFADLQFYSSLRVKLKDHLSSGSDAGVVIYDPEAARRYETPPPASQINEVAGIFQNSWLRWITDAMPVDRAADLVHFVGHGYRSFDNGAIALAPSPIEDFDRYWARFVGAQQLAAFMTQVGAWGVGFSSPQSRVEARSLRLLSDNLARIVPGPVYFHDLKNDGPCADLNKLYRFLTSSEALPPTSSRLSLYYHPKPADDGGLESSVTSASSPFGADEQLREVFANGKRPPRWVAASQRAIERSATEIFHRADQEMTLDPETREGAENAMKFVTSLIGGGDAATSGDAMIRGVTTALGKTSEQIRSTLDTIREAFAAGGEPGPTPPTGPDAVRALNRYAKALDDAGRLVSNLCEQPAVSDDLKRSVKIVADELTSHLGAVESASRSAAVENTSRSVKTSLPSLVGDVSKQADRIKGLIHNLTTQFDAALTPHSSASGPGHRAAPAHSKQVTGEDQT